MTLKLEEKKAIVFTVYSAELQKKLQKMKPQLLSLLGSTRSRLGDNAAAIKAMERSLQLEPDQASTLLNLALAQVRALDLPAAQATYRRVQKLMGSVAPVTELGNILRAVKERLQALRAYGLQGQKLEGALAERPEAHRLLAEIFIITRASAQAIAHLRQVVRLSPQDRRAWSMLALELAASGDLPGAQQVIAGARQQFGDEQGLAALERRLREVVPARRALTRPLSQ